MEVDTEFVSAEYVRRRDEIARLAAGSSAEPTDITYTADEHATWSVAATALRTAWEEHAAPEVLVAAERLGLPVDEVPQLAEVTRRLRPLTGFEFRAVPGLVPVREFFGSLARGRFLSTQYVRHHSNPLYTPEPDVIHEVLGHGTLLADDGLAQLHVMAGAAIERLQTQRAVQFVADVFWFSAEFGVIVDQHGRPRAYGAGLLSSMGELQWFSRHADIRPLDLASMGTLDYDIDHYQPVLFGARSVAEAVDVVGGFFDVVDDDLVERLLSEASSAAA